jgi:hypothetical protein
LHGVGEHVSPHVGVGNVRNRNPSHALSIAPMRLPEYISATCLSLEASSWLSQRLASVFGAPEDLVARLTGGGGAAGPGGGAQDAEWSASAWGARVEKIAESDGVWEVRVREMEGGRHDLRFEGERGALAVRRCRGWRMHWRLRVKEREQWTWRRGDASKKRFGSSWALVLLGRAW